MKQEIKQSIINDSNRNKKNNAIDGIQLRGFSHSHVKFITFVYRLKAFTTWKTIVEQLKLYAR